VSWGHFSWRSEPAAELLNESTEEMQSRRKWVEKSVTCEGRK
jgi:hypothetical protein